MNSSHVQPQNVHALQIVRELEPWRKQLATGFGTTHGNASLQLIDVLILMLAGFFNPMVRSQRLIEALSSQAWMQDKTGVGRVPRSTFSDAISRFDPQPLRGLIEALSARVPALQRRDADLATITRQVIAADGSYFNLAGEVAWALHNRRGNGHQSQSRVRFDLQLDANTFAPISGEVAGREASSEPAACMGHLRPGVIYVVDRNFGHFGFVNAVLDAGSNLVLRLKKNIGFAGEQQQPLTARDHELGVRSDTLGRLGGPVSKSNQGRRSRTTKPPENMLRQVVVWDEQNQQELILVTDLLDVPAYVIAALYRQRWQIELFFKWLKCYARVDHAISHHPNGLSLQFYVAIIGTLLLHLSTGRSVSKYALFWMGCVLSGQATWAEMQQGLARIEREKELARIRLKRKREMKKLGL